MTPSEAINILAVHFGTTPAVALSDRASLRIKRIAAVILREDFRLCYLDIARALKWRSHVSAYEAYRVGRSAPDLKSDIAKARDALGFTVIGTA